MQEEEWVPWEAAGSRVGGRLEGGLGHQAEIGVADQRWVLVGGRRPVVEHQRPQILRAGRSVIPIHVKEILPQM